MRCASDQWTWQCTHWGASDRSGTRITILADSGSFKVFEWSFLSCWQGSDGREEYLLFTTNFMYFLMQKRKRKRVIAFSQLASCQNTCLLSLHHSYLLCFCMDAGLLIVHFLPVPALRIRPATTLPCRDRFLHPTPTTKANFSKHHSACSLLACSTMISLLG